MGLPATDAFTGTNGTPIQTNNPSWSINIGNFDIQSNALAPNELNTECGANWNADAFDADQYAQATLAAKTAGVAIGVAVRLNTSEDDYYYGLYVDTNFIYLFEMSNGSWAELDSAASPAAGSVIKLTAIGTTGANLKGYDDGVEVVSGSDNSLSSGAAGVSGYSDSGASALIDNWEGGNVGGAVVTRKFQRVSVLGV